MKQSVKFFFGIKILTLLFLSGCRQSQVEPQLLEGHYLIQENKLIEIQNGLIVKPDTVQVLICPSNVSCLIPNNAGVHFTISKGNKSYSIRLRAFIPNYNRRVCPSCPIDSTSVEFDSQRYKIILRDGKYLEDSESIKIQQAIVQVSPL